MYCTHLYTTQSKLAHLGTQLFFKLTITLFVQKETHNTIWDPAYQGLDVRPIARICLPYRFLATNTGSTLTGNQV